MRWIVLGIASMATVYGQVTVDVSESGAVTAVCLAGKPVTGALSLFVPRPGWQGKVLSSDAMIDVQKEVKDTGCVVKGVAAGEDGPVADISTYISPLADAVTVTYEYTPRRPLETQASLIRLSLPIADYAGKSYLLKSGTGSRAGIFPKELPAPYTFFGDAGFEMLAIPGDGDTYLGLEPDWETVERVSVQDNRQFGSTNYEVQMYLRGDQSRKPGKTVRGSLRLTQVQGSSLRVDIEKYQEPNRQLLKAMRGDGQASIRALRLSAETVPAYGLLEINVDLKATYTNPFDSDDVALEAEITCPDGGTVTVPGFLYCPYDRSRVGTAEHLSPMDGVGWRVRFCPRQPGAYRGCIVLVDGSQKDEKEFSFTVTRSEHPGFVRVAKGNPFYLEYENGAPYFAIGENVCWPGPGGTYDYDNYWKRLGDSGANYARLWIGPFDCFTLERIAKGRDDPAGLGRIDLAAAWRIDYVLQEAVRHGINIMFCIDSFNSLRIRKPHAIWNRCPYNQANGGPIATPKEFFTNAEAKTLFKRRLRYIVARWGHHPSLLAWEFWNEVNIIETYVSADVAAWHREMARYLRSIDPYDHLITTSWAGVKGDPAVDSLPEMDYIQSHQYGARDAADHMIQICRQKNKTYGKPHYFGEFGTGTRAEGTLDDVDGIHLHNGLWSGIFGNAMGTAMLWWWDNYVEPKDLYHLFTPVAKFARGIPFNTVHYVPVDSISAGWHGTPPPPRWEDLVVNGKHASWSPASFNQPRELVCQRDGRVEGLEQLSRVQHGTGNHPALHNPVTFQVDYANPGRFVVHVGKVSGYGGAALQISLDGELKLDRQFPDEDDHHKEITSFNGDYEITVPAGKHTILVENPGKDWVFVDYSLPGYVREDQPPVRVYALTAADASLSDPAALLWVRHDAFSWYRHSLGLNTWPVAPTEITLTGLPDGRYRMELWDTLDGQTDAGSMVNVVNGMATIVLPAFEKSLAVKLMAVER